MGKDTLTVRKRFPNEASAVHRPTGFLICAVLTFLVFQESRSLAANDLPRITSITFKGNEFIGEGELVSWMHSKIGGTYDEESIRQDVERILAGYGSEGYFFASVDSLERHLRVDGTSVDIVITLQEAEPCILLSIAIEGKLSIDEKELLSSMSLRPGDRFVPRILESDLQRILHQFERHGFPFAKISIQDIGLQRDSSDVTASPILFVDEGQLAQITELQITGNESTKDYVIAREARLSKDEIFRSDLPEKIKRRLERIQLFSSVSLPELYLREDGSAGLSVRVIEGNQNHFDGVVGYVPSSNADEGGTVTGLFDIQFRNLLGTGRRLATRWYREDRHSQEIELRYLEPWVATYPINIRAEFFQRKQDTTYVRRRYEIGGELMISEQFTVGVTFSQASVFPSERQIAIYIPESRTTSYGLSALFDSRDEVVTPAAGILYRADVSSGTKTIKKSLPTSEPGTSNTRRLALDLDHYISPFERQTVAFSLHLRDFRSGSAEASDLFRLGGATTLRGYREAQFLASRLVWLNLEYRVLVGLRSFVYAFVDAAHLELVDRPEAGLVGAAENKLGYGVGIRLDTALGLVGVSLAVGEGDTFSTAKLHFRLVNEF